MKKKLRHEAYKHTPDLKEAIKATPEYQHFVNHAGQHAKRRNILKRLTYAVSASLAVVLFFLVFPLITGNDVQPSEVYFEVNPAFVLKVDANDNVSEFDPLNEDGITLGNALSDIEGKPFEDAIDAIIDEALALGLIDPEESTLLYDVINENSDLEQRHMERLETKLSEIKNARMPDIDMMRGIGGRPTETELDVAREYDLGVMHARIIGNILAESDEYTFEDLAEMNMRELMELSEMIPPRSGNGPHRHPFDDTNGAPPINPPRGRP